MKTITFTCETITPMFLSGADGQTPELRPPSIKGALRFWWRAMNGNLPERKGNGWDYRKMREEESKLFGGTGDNAFRSNLVIQVKNQELNILPRAELVPHKPFMNQQAIKPQQKFEFIFRFRNEEQTQLFTSLFVIVSLLGAVGKRARRGMGSFTINSIMVDNKDTNFKMPTNLSEIQKHLDIINKNQFLVKNNQIISSFNKSSDYPYIKSIEVGNSDSRILNKISSTTHNVKEKNPQSYEVSMGTTFRGRFASPIFVSVLKGNIPIITTLNTVPKRDAYKVNQNLQEDFKQRIL